MNWHVDWQDAVVLLLGVVGIGVAAWLRARLPVDRCRGCAQRDRHGAPTSNG